MTQDEDSSSPGDGPEAADETRPLLQRSSDDDEHGRPQSETLESHQVPSHVARRLYVSHFLSAWNARVFEFGAVLYLATIFAGTLLPMSLYAFARGLATVLFAPAIGQYIDKGDRLQVVRVSIVLQRVVVATSCVIFFMMNRGLTNLDASGRAGMLVMLAIFAYAEKLCSVMNRVSVEKDWVIVVAEKDPIALRSMNAQMRRIDLGCKIFGPLCIALIDGASTEVAIIVNFAMNLSSVVVEYFVIARVYHEVPELQKPKRPDHFRNGGQRSGLQEGESRITHNLRHVRKVTAKTISDFHFYFRHFAFLPSFAGALLYLTVLNFGGQMVTYLLSSGYTSTTVGIARTFSVALEMSATWVAPFLMGRLGPIRGGLWLGSWQVVTLAAGIAVFWKFGNEPVLSASGLVVGTILSRLGLIGLDLCTQVIVQEQVEADSRGAFSTVEASWQNVFELLSYVTTMIFSRPQQFRWPALISLIAVSCAAALFAIFTRIQRGHLLHLDKLCGCWSDEKWREQEDERERASLLRTASDETSA